jgi:GntR family transcriptional regulator
MLLRKDQKSQDTSDRIHRDSYEPVYVQLANILRRKIVDGRLRAGEQLPSEAGLCKIYNVSAMTVRRAINLLVEQGAVSTERGRGTYVRQLDLSAASFNVDELRQLYDNASSVEVKILEVRLVPADPVTAHNLAIPEGERTISLRRLLNTDGKPLFYHYEYLACDIHSPIVEAELEATSLQGLFEGTGHNLFKWGELNMRAGIMSEEEARILQTPMPSAAIYLTHVFYSFEDQPLSWGCFVCRSDQLNFNTIVGIRS